MSPARLRGRRVVVTRARHQAGELTRELERAGAEVAHLPLIEVVGPEDPRPLERAVLELGSFSWVVFTSSNAVEAFFWRRGGRKESGFDLKTAVIGPATARALRERGIEPDVVAGRNVAEGLTVALLPRLGPDDRVLVPQAADARPALVAGLRAAGVEVCAVVAYRKVVPAGLDAAAARLFGDREIGWVTFTSPRIARQFAALFAEDWPRRRDEVEAISIGPTTSAELGRLGVARIVEAASPTPREMVWAAVEGRRACVMNVGFDRSQAARSSQ